MRQEVVHQTLFAQAARLRSLFQACRRYAAAAALVLLACGISYALQALLDYRAPLIFFVAASLIAAWYGGLGPGLVALIAGLLIGDYFFIPPVHRFGAYSPSDLALLMIYASVTSIGLAAITNLHNALQREEQARKWNRELEGRVRERTAELEAFCYSVSHDLRGPIRSIASFSQLLEEDYESRLDDEGKRMLHIVIQSASRMDKLLYDLLELSRLSRKDMQWQTVNLSALVQAFTDYLQKVDPKRKMEIVIAPNLTAQGDEALLRIALENLINNAWKFTGKRAEGHIEFGSELHDGKPVYFVSDNGIGFDMAHAAKLFGVFERLHTEADFPGTGIGLAMVQRVIGRHGGQIWAKAEPNRGATFCFTLPTTQPAST